jgi:hypothetical protein
VAAHGDPNAVPGAPAGGSRGPLGLRESLERVFARQTPEVARLVHADATIRFVVLDYAQEAVTLLLDRRPPQVVDGSEPAEIVIELSREQAAQFIRGDLALPSAVLAGRVAAYGQVRKYLAVDPILRRLLAGADEANDDAGGTHGDA